MASREDRMDRNTTVTLARLDCTVAVHESSIKEIRVKHSEFVRGIYDNLGKLSEAIQSVSDQHKTYVIENQKWMFRAILAFMAQTVVGIIVGVVLILLK